MSSSERQSNHDDENYVPRRLRPEPEPELSADAPKAQEAPAADSTPTESTAPPRQDKPAEVSAATPTQAEAPKPEAETVFDYVVPKETFKQHAKRKHRSTHSGKTKAASEEEMEDAVNGYIFMGRRKKRHHSHHHHHHHRHRRWRRLPLWLRIVIVIIAVLLALAIALAGTYLVMNEIGRRGMHDYDQMLITSPTEPDLGGELATVADDGRTIIYDGTTYEFNKDVMCVAFIGMDEGEGEEAVLNMADAIYLLTVDAETGKVVILGVSRDTMTYVNLYSTDGKFIDSELMQLSYAYAYHSDTVTGGDNTTTALSRLFYGLPLKNYFAINMDALTTLNDTIGGVTLTSSITFVSPIDGRTINAGDTVTLHGKEAEYYVRNRDITVLDSNNDRMRRQQEYIRAFMSSIIPAAKKDLSNVTNLYNEIQVNSDTTLDLPKMTYIASTALTKLNDSSDIEYISLTGEIKPGEHAEMYLKDDDVLRTMLDVFYKPIN